MLQQKQLLCGINSDGEITTTDTVIALEIAAGSRPFDAAANVSSDSRGTFLDALMILQTSNNTPTHEITQSAVDS